MALRIVLISTILNSPETVLSIEEQCLSNTGRTQESVTVHLDSTKHKLDGSAFSKINGIQQ